MPPHADNNDIQTRCERCGYVNSNLLLLMDFHRIAHNGKQTKKVRNSNVHHGYDCMYACRPSSVGQDLSTRLQADTHSYKYDLRLNMYRVK